MLTTLSSLAFFILCNNMALLVDNRLFEKWIVNVMPRNVRNRIIFISFLFILFFGIIGYLTKSPFLSLFNVILFSITTVIIWYNFKVSHLNKEIIFLFFLFYVFLAFGLGLVFNPLNYKSFDLYAKIYLIGDISITYLILSVSLYLFFYAWKKNKKQVTSYLFYSFFISAIIIIFLFSRFIPAFQDAQSQLGAAYAERSYYVKVLSIFLLLVFWLSYYRKNFSLSEYINVIIFLFMLYSVLDALYYIAGGFFDVNLFMYSLYFSTVINLVSLYFWWKRLQYLYSPEAIENERYLENFEYLKGLIKKPRESLVRRIFTNIPPGFLLTFLAVILIATGIYYWKFKGFANLFVTLNVIIILFAIFSAIGISLIAIKQDWKNQYRFIKERKNKVKKISVS